MGKEGKLSPAERKLKIAFCLQVVKNMQRIQEGISAVVDFGSPDSFTIVFKRDEFLRCWNISWTCTKEGASVPVIGSGPEGVDIELDIEDTEALIHLFKIPKKDQTLSSNEILKKYFSKITIRLSAQVNKVAKKLKALAKRNRDMDRQKIFK